MWSQRLTDAFSLAAELHRAQLRKGTAIPYLSHLMGVASLVLDNGGEEDHVIAALLHDAVEDQGGLDTLTEIRRRFGDRVAAIVEDCSDAFPPAKPAWRERKERYLRHLETADFDARLVSAADKLHNLRAILSDFRILGEEVWSRFNAGPDEILWYYDEIARIIEERGPEPISRELAATLSDLRSLARP
jgi:(p)ppGpp synthase/HD superfamily hydrolase